MMQGCKMPLWVGGDKEEAAACLLILDADGRKTCTNSGRKNNGKILTASL